HETEAFEDVRGARIGIYRPIIENVEIRQPPRSVVNDVTRADRVIIREYAEARVPGLPSVALLAVLDSGEGRRCADRCVSGGGGGGRPGDRAAAAGTGRASRGTPARGGTPARSDRAGATRGNSPANAGAAAPIAAAS